MVSTCFTVSSGRYFKWSFCQQCWPRQRVLLLDEKGEDLDPHFALHHFTNVHAACSWAVGYIHPTQPSSPPPCSAPPTSALQLSNRRQEGNEPSVRARAASLDHIFPASSAGDQWHTELPSLIWAPEACSIQSRIATPREKRSRSFSYSKNLPRR